MSTLGKTVCADEQQTTAEAGEESCVSGCDGGPVASSLGVAAGREEARGGRVASGSGMAGAALQAEIIVVDEALDGASDHRLVVSNSRDVTSELPIFAGFGRPRLVPSVDGAALFLECDSDGTPALGCIELQADLVGELRIVSGSQVCPLQPTALCTSSGWLVCWVVSDTRNGSTTVCAAEMPAGGALQQPNVLSEARTLASSIVVEAGADGLAVVCWQELAGTAARVVARMVDESGTPCSKARYRQGKSSPTLATVGNTTLLGTHTTAESVRRHSVEVSRMDCAVTNLIATGSSLVRSGSYPTLVPHAEHQAVLSYWTPDATPRACVEFLDSRGQTVGQRHSVGQAMLTPHHIAIASTSLGIVVCWLQPADSDGLALMCRRVAPSGPVGAAIRLDSGRLREPQLVAAKDVVVVAWTRIEDSKPSLRLATISIEGASDV